MSGAMKILVFGQTGQVAQELRRQVPAGITLEAYGRDQADFTDPERCVQLLEASDADAVINAVAYTAVDQAEEDEALAVQVNATTPGLLAAAAARRGLPFVQISTDYVFDGAGETAFAPDHPTAPLGAYGRSKLAGEQAVRAAAGPHAIVRTSWVVSPFGANFVKTMLRLGAERDQLNIVADQIGGPTPAADIAILCLSVAQQLVAQPDKSGTYHISGAPDVSWADFARHIFAEAGLTCAVNDIPSSAYPTPVKRPHNSRMDNASTVATFGLERPDWRRGLRDILTQLDVKAS